MDFLRVWRSKVSAANESLAAAHKAWRDEKLDHREQLAREEERKLADRRADIESQLQALRAMEARRWRRRSWIVLIAILSAASGFVVGANSGPAIIDYLQRPHASGETPAPTKRP